MKGKITEYLPAILTCLLLLTAFYIIGEIFERNFIVTLMLLCLSWFVFSYTIKDKHRVIRNIILVFSCLAVIFYISVDILNNPFDFEKIMFILIKGLLFTGVICCFNSYPRKNLVCVQSVSLTLFMYSFLFIDTNVFKYKLLVLLYMFIWLLIIRFSIPYCYGSLSQIFKVIFATLLVFLLALGITLIIRSKVAIDGTKYIDMFLKKSNLEERFVKFYESMYDKISSLETKFSEEKKINLGFLSSLTKEPSCVRETEDARLKLKDFLKKTVKDIESKKEDDEQFLEEYLNKKVYDKTEEIKQELSKKIMNSEGDLSVKLSAILKLNDVKRQDTLEEAEDEFDSLNKVIDEVSLNSGVKQELQGTANDFKQWQVYSLYNEVRDSLENKIDSLSEGKGKLSKIFDETEKTFLIAKTSKLKEEVKNLDNILSNSQQKEYFQKEFQKMLELKENLLLLEAKSLKVLPESVCVPLGKTIDFEAILTYSDDSHEDVTDSVIWKSVHPQNAIVEKGKLYTFLRGETVISAQLKENLESNHVNVIIEETTTVIAEDGDVDRTGIKETQLISIALEQQKIHLRLGETAFIAVTGCYKDGSQKDISGIVDWFVENESIVRAEKGSLKAKKAGRTRVYAQYEGIKSPFLKVSVSIFPSQVLKIIFYALGGGIIIVFMIFFIAAWIETIKFKKILHTDPLQFIDSLYKNAQQVIGVCGVLYKEAMPFIKYARIVDDKFSLKENRFLKFTQEFLEAQYSSRVVTPEYAVFFLNEYNKIMRIIRKNTPAFLVKFFIMIFRRYPFIFM